MPIEKRWVVKPQGDRATVEALATQLGMSTVLTNLLVQRGIDTAEKAKKFFSPALRDLHDPFLMKKTPICALNALLAEDQGGTPDGHGEALFSSSS